MVLCNGCDGWPSTNSGRGSGPAPVAQSTSPSANPAAHPSAAALSFVLMAIIVVLIAVYARIVGSERLG